MSQRSLHTEGAALPARPVVCCANKIQVQVERARQTNFQ
jgi:hypothetical protein